MSHCSHPAEFSHALDFMASVWTDEPYGKDEAKDSILSNQWAGNLETFWPYCCKASAVMVEIQNRLLERLHEQDRLDLYFLLYQPLFNPLLELSLHGIRVNNELRRERLADCVATCVEMQDEVSAIAGTPSVARVYGANQTIVDTVTLTVAWNNEDIDTASYHDNSTNNSRLTVAVAAYYRVTAHIQITAGSAAFDITIGVNQNGSAVGPTVRTPVIASDITSLVVSEIFLAAATDYFEIKIDQSSGQNMTMTGGNAGSMFSIERINGTT